MSYLAILDTDDDCEEFMTIHGKSKAFDKPQRRQASSYKEKWFKTMLKCCGHSSLLNIC